MATHSKFTSQGYKLANEIVDTINFLGGRAYIGETWMDYGAEWSWETILVWSNRLELYYQLLNPRDFDEINDGTISKERIREMISNIFKD